MESDVKLISVTPDAEKVVAYIARVSSDNQDNPEYAKLIKYLIKHKHWSPFEHGFMTLEIITGRDVAPQILRHKSMFFQEFSGRYQFAQDKVKRTARRQDLKNRQNSIDDLPESTKDLFISAQNEIWKTGKKWYDTFIELGVAKECARSLLPMLTQTKLYVTGNIRSWIHYIDLRGANGTQKEHMDIALKCKDIFIDNFPVISEALEWKKGETNAL
jgi:thymidylate synthase (FAD)